jgi:hypothetical protein
MGSNLCRYAEEFSGVCNNLSDMTLLKVLPGREDRQRKVSLAVHQDDVVGMYTLESTS